MPLVQLLLQSPAFGGKRVAPVNTSLIRAGCFCFSVYICSSLNNVLSRFTIPYLALPFNIVAIWWTFYKTFFLRHRLWG
jgi:urea transporter